MGFSYPMTGQLVRTGEERATLVKRTYGLVLVSILFTMGGVALGLQQTALMEFVIAHPFITMLITFAPLLMATRVRTQFPANVGFVLLFTLVEGVAISPFMYLYGRQNPDIIWQAGALTLSSFGVLTAYAWLSKRDFSAWGGFFMVGLWVLIGTSLLNLFFHSSLASLWIAGGTVLVFSGLLVFDTWRIRNQFGPEDYVMAAVQIYLDLLNMFLAVIQLLGGRRD
ncbi:MAG: Bax inhibitor-1/YccA family protein [Gemmatimonadetes bacterium]|nr:Bax inhibitor-1/YccA family protein [Gemmatimonadota bacterium]